MQSMSVTQYRGKQVHTYRKWCTYCKSHFMTQNFKSYSRRVTCGQPACQTKLKRAWYKMPKHKALLLQYLPVYCYFFSTLAGLLY